jgi:uncharacterized membrane protein YeaQ/YmgE (transglycosylase-associated protein family)
MGFVIWIIAGAMLGGAVSALVRRRARGELFLNVALGIAGVLSGGWLLGIVIGASAFDPGKFSIESLLVSLLGTAVLLGARQVFGRVVAVRAPTRRAAGISGDPAPVASSP